MENATLEFTPGGAAGDRPQGDEARRRRPRLRAVIEELMLDLMYDLPEHKEEQGVYQITEEMVEGTVQPTLFAARKVKKESA